MSQNRSTSFFNRLSPKQWLIILFTFFFLIRFIHLDADFNPYQLTQLIPNDEAHYTIPAFNLYNYGEINHRVVDFIPDDSGATNNIFHNIMVYLSLKIFGNTYYGLRFASVFISILSLFLFYLILRKILNYFKKSNHFVAKWYNYLIFFPLIYLGTDFSFLSLSRIAEPTIFRTFSMLFIIYLFIHKYDPITQFSRVLTFVIGFMAASSVFFVYFYNIFIFVASLSIIILISLFKNKKELIIEGTLFLLGSLLSFGCYSLYLKFNYQTNFLEYLGTLSQYQYRLSTYQTDAYFISFFKEILNNMMLFFSTNIFRLNLSFLFIILLIMPLFLYQTIKNKETLHIIIFLFIGMLLGQSLFENSYSLRRLTMMLPLLLIGIVIIVISKQDLFKSQKKIWYIMSLLISMGIFSYYSIFSGKGAFLSETGFKLDLFFLIITISTFLMLLLYRKNILFLLFMLLTPSLYLTAQNYLVSSSYHYKETMIKLAPLINDQVTPGQASFVFRLYNRSKPVLNWYIYELNTKKYTELFNQLLNSQKSPTYTLDFYTLTPIKMDTSSSSSFRIETPSIFPLNQKIYLLLYKITQLETDPTHLNSIKFYNKREITKYDSDSSIEKIKNPILLKEQCKKMIINVFEIYRSLTGYDQLQKKERDQFDQMFQHSLLDSQGDLFIEFKNCIKKNNRTEINCLIQAKSPDDILKCKKNFKFK